ncbi:MAG: O-acetyl-ADP-ribose deacetylase [Kofleriaceae bacterium]
MQLEILVGDITKLAVDAIVNAASSALAGGGGVDGAIHRAAGSSELLAACRPLAPCPTGEARLTPGFRLPAKWIIHVVGPVWRGGNQGEPALLEACYRNALAIAAEKLLTSIAFPAVSTGIYGYPIDDACAIAARTVKAHGQIDRVVFCMFSERDRAAMQRALDEAA